MPSLTRKRDAAGIPIDSAKLYEVLVTHVNELGCFKEGEVLNAAHPALKISPEYFIEQGLTSDEKHALRLRQTIGRRD